MKNFYFTLVFPFQVKEKIKITRLAETGFKINVIIKILNLCIILLYTPLYQFFQVSIHSLQCIHCLILWCSLKWKQCILFYVSKLFQKKNFEIVSRSSQLDSNNHNSHFYFWNLSALVGGWVNEKAVLRIANSNQISNINLKNWFKSFWCARVKEIKNMFSFDMAKVR